MIPNLGICIFVPNLQLKKLKGVDCKYSNINKKAKKYPHKAFLNPNLGIFVLTRILQLEKFQGVEFKYDNILLDFQNKTAQI